jgi:hypothetical protein
VSPVRYELGLYIPEDDILHSHCRENFISYIALSGWTLQRRCNVSPVRYELGLYILEDAVLHSHCRENFISYIALTGFMNSLVFSLGYAISMKKRDSFVYWTAGFRFPSKAGTFLSSTKPPTQRHRIFPFQGKRRLKRDAYYLLLSSVEVNNNEIKPPLPLTSSFQ